MIEGLVVLATVTGTLVANILFDWATGYPGRVARWRDAQRDGEE